MWKLFSTIRKSFLNIYSSSYRSTCLDSVLRFGIISTTELSSLIPLHALRYAHPTSRFTGSNYTSRVHRQHLYVPSLRQQMYVPSLRQQPYVPSLRQQLYVQSLRDQPYVPSHQLYVPSRQLFFYNRLLCQTNSQANS